MNRGPTAWVVTADASLTGVPVVLARLLRWSSQHTSSNVHVIAVRGGPLLATFEQLASSVTVLEPTPHRSIPNALSAGLTQRGHRSGGRRINNLNWRRKVRDLPVPDIIIIHGAGAASASESIAVQGVPVVLHLHELELALARCMNTETASSLFGSARLIMAVSTPVAELAASMGAEPRKIEIVPGVVESLVAPPEGSNQVSLGSDTELVAGIGAPGWRKGTDRFVALAHELSRTRPTARFEWIGGRPGGLLSDALIDGSDATPVRWHDPQVDPWRVFDDPALLVVPSREDPLPLVALEAGQRGIAVIGARTGGLPELLAAGRGRVVDGHDLMSWASALTDMLDDHEERLAAGAALRQWVTSHHSVTVVAPRWHSLIQQAASS